MRFRPCVDLPLCALVDIPCVDPRATALAPEEEDAGWMRRALELADAAERSGEVPVAALLVRDGTLLGSGYNRNIQDHDPSAHAEIVALRMAGTKVGNHRLPGSVLYCTLEPCPMCVGALIHARIARLVYAADDPKTGAVTSVYTLLGDPRHNHRIEVRRGLLAEESAQRLRDFFRRRRQIEKESRREP